MQRKQFTFALIMLMSLFLIGCGNSKAKEFTDFFQAENKILDTYTAESKATVEQFAKAADIKATVSDFAKVAENARKARADLEKLNAPAELAKYKSKDIELIDKNIALFEFGKEALEKADVKSLEELTARGEEFDQYAQNAIDVLDELRTEAAKAAGLKIIKEGDKFRFE